MVQGMAHMVHAREASSFLPLLYLNFRMKIAQTSSSFQQTTNIPNNFLNLRQRGINTNPSRPKMETHNITGYQIPVLSK